MSLSSYPRPKYRECYKYYRHVTKTSPHVKEQECKPGNAWNNEEGVHRMKVVSTCGQVDKEVFGWGDVWVKLLNCLVYRQITLCWPSINRVKQDKPVWTTDPDECTIESQATHLTDRSSLYKIHRCRDMDLSVHVCMGNNRIHRYDRTLHQLSAYHLALTLSIKFLTIVN